MEAALQGLPAIALSQFLGPDNVHADDPFESARVHGPGLIRRLLPSLETREDYRLFHSINFPPRRAAETRGAVVAPQGYRRDCFFGIEPHKSPSGRTFHWIKGGPQHTPTAPGSDAERNLAGYISVTPMRADLTAHDTLAATAKLLET